MTDKKFWEIADSYESIENGNIVIKNTVNAISAIVKADKGDVDKSLADTVLLFRGEPPTDFISIVKDLCKNY